MEGNDLGTWNEQYHVVVLEPTIMTAPPLRRRDAYRLRHGWSGAVEQALQNYQTNDLMVRWIAGEGYLRSITTEVWGFGIESLFEALCEIVDGQCGRYVQRYVHWDHESEAESSLIADRSITAVYDADPDRVDRLWRFRGHRVTPGFAP